MKEQKRNGICRRSTGKKVAICVSVFVLISGVALFWLNFFTGRVQDVEVRLNESEKYSLS